MSIPLGVALGTIDQTRPSQRSANVLWRTSNGAAAMPTARQVVALGQATEYN